MINNVDYVSAATREQVLEVVARLGYRPNRMARGLASNRSFFIGLTIPDITNPFFPEVLRGVERVAQNHGYSVLIYNTDLNPDHEREGLALLEETRADGFIICTLRMADDELRQFIERQPTTVLVNRTLPGSEAGIVRVDLASAMGRIVQHLVDAGRREIGYLNIPQGTSISYSAHERYTGFTMALHANHIPLNPDNIRETPATAEVARATARDLLQARPAINALVCYNDVIAAGALEACADLGLPVPGRVAVTGFDDIMFASMFKVGLTTAHVPKFELGMAAANLLLDLINGKKPEAEIILDAELVIRQSTPGMKGG